jgi:D-aspartate ligase
MPSKIARARAIVDDFLASRPGGTAGALVMAADYRALGVVRSLGRRGIPVWLLKQGGHLVASASRYVRRNVPWSPADDKTLVEQLLSLGAEHGLDGWLLFPTDDHAVALASRHHQLLSQQYVVTVPPWDHLSFACDKRLLHETAAKLGIHQPWTAWPRNRNELASLECPFPVILKPATRLRANTLATPKAWWAEDQESLLAHFDEASNIVGAANLIVQEAIPGNGETQFSYAALGKDGRSLASMVARRTRQYPKEFGQFSTFVETVDEPQIIGPSERLLTATRFTGLVELEFKQDPRNRQFKLLDVNPRVWGWHTLSRRVGIDFPYLLWLLMHGEPIPSTHSHSGERWVLASADLLAALQEIRAGQLSVRDYLRSLRGLVEPALFAFDDPGPALLDLPLFAWCKVKEIFQRHESLDQVSIEPAQTAEPQKVSTVEAEPG